MTNPQKQTKSFNVNCWLDVRTLASLIVLLDKRKALSGKSYSTVVNDCLSFLHDILIGQGLIEINSTDQALQELQKRGFSIKQLRSPSKLGKQLVLEDQELGTGIYKRELSAEQVNRLMTEPLDTCQPQKWDSTVLDPLEQAMIQSSQNRAQNEPKEREDSKDEPKNGDCE